MKKENTEKKEINFSTVKNNIITEGTKIVSRRVKDHFGFEMKFREMFQVRTICNWIKSHDKNFKKHIENPYVLEMVGAEDDVPMINSTFILKLDEATYVLVKGYVIENTMNKAYFPEIYLYIFGKKAVKIYRQITKYINDNFLSVKMLYSIVGAKSSGDSTYWTCNGRELVSRSIDTLFFDNEVKKKIIKHIDDWIKNTEIYISRGIGYKTGILLYGIAGTGKSSLATAIATHLHCSLISIDMSTFGYIDIANVVNSIEADKERYVILLDEIDAVFTSRDDENITDSQKEKTTKLLALLDSSQSPSNVVFVATTNYIDRLDTALLRKGRFDLTIELDNLSKETALEMCRSFNLSDEVGNKLLAEYKGNVNPANLQAKILDTIANKKRV